MKAVIFVAALLVPSAALASSDDAWADLDKAAKAACTADVQKKDPGFKKMADIGTVIGIGGKDNDQFYALVFRSQPNTHGTHYLCLYDKVSKKPQTSELSTELK